MTDTSKDYKRWEHEINFVKNFCQENGLDFSLSSATYIIAKLKGSDVCIVLYPYKTDCGNYHLRVRDENSKNKQRSIDLRNKLEESYRLAWEEKPDYEVSSWQFKSKNNSSLFERLLEGKE